MGLIKKSKHTTGFLEAIICKNVLNAAGELGVNQSFAHTG